MVIGYVVAYMVLRVALYTASRWIGPVLNIVSVLAQLAIVAAAAYAVYTRYRSRMFWVDGRVVMARSQSAAEQLSRTESITRDTVRAVTGKSLDATISATDSGIAGVTTGKRSIRVCINGEDDDDAVAIVSLHEAAHALNASYGHDASFRAIQDRLVTGAVKLGHIRPFKDPKQVCGTRVTWPIRSN